MPVIRHRLKLVLSPLCQFCSQSCICLLHLRVWGFPHVWSFWLQAAKSLSEILNERFPFAPYYACYMTILRSVDRHMVLTSERRQLH